MELVDEVIQRLRADIDSDSQKIRDFLIEMLRIKLVNPRMGVPGRPIVHSSLKPS